MPIRKGGELRSGSAELLLAKLARWELWEGSSDGDEQEKDQPCVGGMEMVS